jgi:HK97 family phage major capsid protein
MAAGDEPSRPSRPVPHRAGDGCVDSGPELLRHVEPWTESVRDMRPGELRSRALAAIETATGVDDNGRESATQIVDNNVDDTQAEISRHIVATSRPDYSTAIRRWMRNPQGGAATWTEQERAAVREVSETRTALSLTNANGGFLVPFELDPTIILTNASSINPIREISRVVQTTTNVWHGVSSAGVTAEWLAEAAEASDASPSFTQPSVTAHRAAAYLQASLEVAQDSNIGDQIAVLIADAKANLEATAFATGNGVTQPFGVVSATSGSGPRIAGSSGAAGAAGAADLVVADTYAMANQLPPRYRQNSSWLGEQTTFNKLRSLGTSLGQQYWAQLDAALPALLLGRPVYQSSAYDASIVSGSNDDVLTLGDF